MKIKKIQKIVFILSIVIFVLSIIGLIGSIITEEIVKSVYILSHVNNLILAAFVLSDAYFWYRTDIEKNDNK